MPVNALQEAVRKLHEAQAALEDIHKAAAVQEAAQTAAEALHPWPADARLVPANHPQYPSAQPQILHPHVAALGRSLTSLPGGLQQSHDYALNTNSQSLEGEAAASHDGTDAATLGSDSQTSDAGAGRLVTRQHGVTEQASLEDSSREPRDEVHMSGWQLRLQSAVPQQQLQQVCTHHAIVRRPESRRLCQWDMSAHLGICSTEGHSKLQHGGSRAECHSGDCCTPITIIAVTDLNTLACCMCCLAVS